MGDIKGWVKRQYEAYHPFQYITCIEFDPNFSDKMVFSLEFTDTNLSGTITIPVKKLMTLDVTYDDFILSKEKG